MVDKNENILVEFDYNNIIIVDPNKIIDENGVAKQRLVQHENLVMYANLETRVLPRTKLAEGVANNDKIETVSIASINFLKPGGKTFLDTSWTDEITGKGTTTGEGVNQPKQTSIKNPNRDNDFYIRQTIQSGGKPGSVDNGLLGITNINIRQNTSFMPTISIELVDVKGRALFESGDNSPYAAFFNLPYPLFYLTIKGYYGKAVRLGLMLQKFNARYQPDSGNFKIDLMFYTYKYTILSELSMAALIAAPHMYKTRISRQSSSGGPSALVRVNDTITERGYQKIKEMYSEYKSKGLIPEDLPELTLVQLRELLENFIKDKLDTFTKQNLEPIDGCDDYQKLLKEYQGTIFYYTAGRVSWFNKYMDKNNFYILNNQTKTKVYTFKKEFNTPELRQVAISDLDALVREFTPKLAANPVAGDKGSYKIDGKTYNVKVTNPVTINVFNAEIFGLNVDLKETYFQRKGVQPVDNAQLNELKKELAQNSTFNTSNVKLKDGNSLPVSNFYYFEGPNSFIDLTDKMGRDLKVIREEIEQRLTEALSRLLENKKEGIGFIPNIRNVLAVVFANGEAFLRMMDDVHTKAWEKRDNEIRKKIILSENTSGASQETFNNGDSQNTPIYPWPQYIVETSGEDGHEKYELRYPGDASLVSKTKGYLSEVWPEIEFVEEFIKGFTERKSPPVEQANNNEVSDVKRVSLNAIEFPVGNYIFSNKEEVKFFYEIYERLVYLVNYSKMSRANDVPSFTDPIIKIVTECEKTNIKNGLEGGNPFIIEKLKNYSINSANFLQLLRQFSNNGTGESWQNLIRGIFNTKYIRNTISNASFEFISSQVLTEKFTQPAVTLTNEDKIQEFLSSSTNSKFDFTDTYPFTNNGWVKKYLAQSATIDSAEAAFKTPEVLKYNSSNKIFANFLPTTTSNFGRPITSFIQKVTEEPSVTSNNTLPTNQQLKTFYNRKPEQRAVTEGSVRYLNYSGNVSFEQTTSMLNTPYFVNSIQDGLKKFRNYEKHPFVATAYLFLNSLPLATLKEKYSKYENEETSYLDYIFATMKKFGAVHRMPYSWILKYGSIWHRYKKYVEDGVDILDGCWKNFDYVTNYDPITSATTKTYSLIINNSPIDIVLENNTIIGTGLSAETSSLINIGFYPKLINDFNVFLNGYELIQSNSQINGTCSVSGTTLKVDQVNISTLQAGYTLAGLNLLPNTTIISQIDGTIGGVGRYVITPAQTGSTALFSVTNASSVGYTSVNIQNALSNSGLSMYYVSNAIINEAEGFDPNNRFRDLRVIPWSLSVDCDNNQFMYLLPSCGSLFNQTRNECINNSGKLTQEITGNTAMYNGSVRLLWSLPHYGYFDNDKISKVTPSDYIKSIKTGDTPQDAFTLRELQGEYAKIDEIFSVFEKEILDGFETEFLKFSNSVYDYESDTTNVKLEFTPTEIANNSTDNSNVISNEFKRLTQEANNIIDTSLQKNFKNVQGFMRTLLKVPKTTGSTGFDFVKKVQSSQFATIQPYLSSFLDYDVTFKYGNPSNFDRKLFESFSTLPIVDPYKWEKYTTFTPTALPKLNGGISLLQSQTNNPEAWQALQLYVGFSEIPELKYSSNGSYITDFFIDLNVAFTPENVQLFAPIIKIYATQKLNQFQTNYIPPPQPQPTQGSDVVATTLLKSGGTINVEKRGIKFRTIYRNSDNIILFEGAYENPPNSSVFTPSGSDSYYSALTNTTITGIFGSTSTNPTAPQFVVRFDRVTPSSYSPAPVSLNSSGSATFTTSMNNYLNKVDTFLNRVIDSLMIDVRNSLDAITINPEEQTNSDLQGEPQTKLELWETFKALNDKWIAGNDFKTRTLFEDVLLLDRASRNIGDKVLVDIYKLKDRLKNINTSSTMLIFVQTILVENNFVVMNIPSYVNFYGVQDAVKNPKPKIEGTLDFANTLFGTFLNVDYRESTSKMVCFYGGKASEQLDLKNNVDYRKRSDAFELRRASDNPLVENQIGKNDWDKSNKVVGFNVDIGPQNQGIFMSFNVGQDAGKATSESLEATNQLANQGGNRAASTQSVSLYNLYKNRSYSCEVEMMGNALIQPTMYFNLRNVPMFSGPYMILEVNHSIRPGMFSTRFSGIRQPTAALPKIDNFMQSLKQKLVQTIIEKNKQERDAATASAKTNSTSVRTSATQTFKFTGVGNLQNCSAGTKYNTYTAEKPQPTFQTLQAVVNGIAQRSDSVLVRLCMFARIYFASGGDNIIESYANNLSGIVIDNNDWGPSASYFSGVKKFYCNTSNQPVVYFDTFEDHLNFMFARWSTYPSSLRLQNNVADITKFVIITTVADFKKGEGIYNSYVGTEQLKSIEDITKTAIDLYNSVNR